MDNVSISDPISPLVHYREWINSLELEWSTIIADAILKDLYFAQFFLDTDPELKTWINQSIKPITDVPGNLLKVIDRHIEFNDADLEIRFCRQLFGSTEFTLLEYDNGLPTPVDQMQKSLDENPELLPVLKILIKEQQDVLLKGQKMKAKWKTFTKDKFNLTLFWKYQNDKLDAIFRKHNT